MNGPALWSLLVPAVGGQGGGVLSEWIVEAAALAGLAAHGTSIPGVAQRTGATTYYVEVATAGGSGADAPGTPAFSLYPIPGALDVLLAPELLEVGRMIELGFPSPGRTTIITSTHRLYSIHEKITTAGHVYPSERLLAAARAFSRDLLAFDALALAREHGTEANAILLGALAGLGALPVPADAFRAAVARKGVQVRANLAGFELGLARAAARATTVTTNGPAALVEPSARAGEDPLVAGLPDAVRPVAAEAVRRLVDYQDRAYAARYVARLRPFVAGDAALAVLVARRLAVWMTYEDAIRVADLKTRAARFARIRHDARAPGADLEVTDYLAPDLDELYGILPYRLVRPLAAWAERRWPRGRPTVAQRVRTTTIAGYLRVWLLGRLRALRPRSYRAHHEHARMERWLAAVAEAAPRDVALARELAEAATLVKGYGAVRRRLAATFDALLPALARAGEGGTAAGDAGIAVALARRARELAREGPDGEDQALALARAVTASLDAGDLPAAAARDATRG